MAWREAVASPIRGGEGTAAAPWGAQRSESKHAPYRGHSVPGTEEPPGEGSCHHDRSLLRPREAQGAPVASPRDSAPRQDGHGRGGGGRAAFRPTGPLCAALSCHLPETNPGCVSGFPFQLPGGGGRQSQWEQGPRTFRQSEAQGVAPTERGKVPNRAVESPCPGRWHRPEGARGRHRESGPGDPAATHTRDLPAKTGLQASGPGRPPRSPCLLLLPPQPSAAWVPTLPPPPLTL